MGGRDGASSGHAPPLRPAALSKVLTWSLAPLPRSARINIMSGVMGGMTAHQRQPPASTVTNQPANPA